VVCTYPTAPCLFREEYRLPLLRSCAHIAAYAGIFFGAAGARAVRLSALALLGMTAMIEIFVYPVRGRPSSPAGLLLYLVARGRRPAVSRSALRHQIVNESDTVVGGILRRRMTSWLRRRVRHVDLVARAPYTGPPDRRAPHALTGQPILTPRACRHAAPRCLVSLSGVPPGGALRRL
jgi:hypothetical protein